MTHSTPPSFPSDKLIVSGIHLDLTPALKTLAHEKASKLLRHEPRIVRIRLDLEFDQTRGPNAQFVAKGRVEIGGPDLIAQAASHDAYKSIDLVVSKLDRALRKRAADRKGKRNHPRVIDIGLGLPKTAHP